MLTVYFVRFKCKILYEIPLIVRLNVSEKLFFYTNFILKDNHNGKKQVLMFYNYNVTF